MLEIRKATGADADKVLEYCRSIGGESDNLTFGAEGVSVTQEQEEAYLNSMLDSDRQIFLIAIQNGEIAGIGTFSGFPQKRLVHRGEISISVRRALWGNHIGTRLVEELIRFAKDTTKAEIISLEVRSDNERAIALYHKFGFKQIGIFPGFMKIDGKDISFDCMMLYL